MSRRGILVLAGVLLVQSVIVARVYTPRPHSGGDNAGYVSLAHSLLDRGAYRELWDPDEPPHTKYPPVFALVLAGAVLLGAESWAALKLVPAFAVVLAVAFTFLWARDRRRLVLGGIVALLLGLSESVVYYSQWILSDPLFLALTMAALWSLHRAGDPGGDAARRSGGNASRSGKGSKGREARLSPDGKGSKGKKQGFSPGGARIETLWLAAGGIFVLLAYFTRSAGLPLAAALFLWLGLEKRWRALGIFGGVFGLTAFLWWIRGSVLGGSEYVSEFWLIDPYQPHLGTVGLGGLLDRFTENLGSYVTRIVPGGIVGDEHAFLLPLGIGLSLFTLVGWVLALRKTKGVGEIFFPLYLGLILLWPQAWSGDRFSLPLLPFVFLYSGSALLWLFGSFPLSVRRGAAALLSVALALPAAGQWNAMARGAEACRELTGEGRPRECLSPAQGEYFDLAEWSGSWLPEGSVVTTRKPRIFFAMSGVKAQSIPLERDPDRFLTRIREGGSRYLSLDLLDGVSGYYVYPVLQARPFLFCRPMPADAVGQLGTQLLGVREEATAPEEDPEGAQGIVACPRGMIRDFPRDKEADEAWEIPLLAGGSLQEG